MNVKVWRWDAQDWGGCSYVLMDEFEDVELEVKVDGDTLNLYVREVDY